MTSPPGRTAVLPAGARLGPYEILAPIGAGGMGEVYRARDTRLGRDVAVKVTALDVRRATRAGSRRFEQEARAVGRPQPPEHPRRATTSGRDGGAPYVVIRAARGRDAAASGSARARCPTRKAVDCGASRSRGAWPPPTSRASCTGT